MNSISTVLSLFALAVFGTGCSVDCGSPSQINGRYAIFANQVQLLDLTNEENFPAYESPANGWTEWKIEWNEMVQEDVIVTIDGQAFSAMGGWNDIECGHFTLDISGDYQFEDRLTSEVSHHEFNAVGSFVQFATQIEGVWEYHELWESADGEAGIYAVNGQLSGTDIGN